MLANTVAKVEDAILESYLKNRQPLSIPELKKLLDGGLGETIIRKVVLNSLRILPTTKDVRIMSKDCPGRVHQWRSVRAYHPAREWLVEIINQTRLELPHYKYDQKYRG